MFTKISSLILTTLLLILSFSSLAKSDETTVIPSGEQAFILNLETHKNNVTASWTIAPNTYLYQSRLKFQTPDKINILEPIVFPLGENHHDPDFGQQIIYKKQLNIALKLKTMPNETIQVPLTIHYQGCAAAGFCYPPAVKNFVMVVQNGSLIGVKPLDTTTIKPVVTPLTTQISTAPLPPRPLPALFNTHNIFTLFFGCFILGVILCFTPCVLPMVPMLSTLIVGKKNLKTFRAFSLSSVYVLSMSFTYAIAGIIAALLGQRIQTAFQSPWVLSTFAGLFIILGLELAGHLNLSMPDFIKSRLYQLQTKPHSGTFLGAIALGILATLVASPCVSAPLMGVLGYITQTGNLLVGGLSLFAIGLGMGTPLIIAGTLGGKYLPKAGRWMQMINYGFAILLFGFAIWILERFLPHFIILPLWAILCVYIAYNMGSFDLKLSGIMPRVGMLFVVYSGFLVIGTFQGATDPLKPLMLATHSSPHLKFNTLSSLNALTETLHEAQKNQQPTLVEFYADWCISCKKMEQHTLNHPDVQAQLKHWHLVQANVTANKLNEQALLKKFQLVGPPSILFFDKNGQEQINLRLTGEIKPEQFIEHLKKVQICQDSQPTDKSNPDC